MVTVVTFLPGYICAPKDTPPFENHVHTTMDTADRETTFPETTTTGYEYQYQTVSISEDDGQYHPNLTYKEDGNGVSSTEDDGKYRPENSDDDKRFDDGSYRPSDYITMKTVDEGNEDAMTVVISKLNSKNETHINVSSLQNVNKTRILRRNNIDDGQWVDANALTQVTNDGSIAPKLCKTEATDVGIENYDENADNGTDDGVGRFDEFENGNILVEKTDDGSYRPDAYPLEDYDERADNGTYRSSPGGWRRRKRDCDGCDTEEVQLAPVVFQVGPKKKTPRNKTMVVNSSLEVVSS